MNSIGFLARNLGVASKIRVPLRTLCTPTLKSQEEVVDFSEETIKIPDYVDRKGESLEVWKARLVYQARKRGTLENGILLSTFASKYLHKLDEKQLLDFDRLLNKPGNEWDIFYWAIGTKPIPEEYNHEVMELFVEHCKNKDKKLQNRQPSLFENE